MAISVQNSAASALYGAGNAAVTAEQIKAYVNAPGRTAAEIQQAAVANKVSVAQLSSAMAGNASFSAQNIKAYLAEQGIKPPPALKPVRAADSAAAVAILYGAGNDQLTDAEIRDYISRPGRTAQEVLDGALANGVSAAQIARAMEGDPDYSLDAINQALAYVGVSPAKAAADPLDFRAETLFGSGNVNVSVQEIQDFINQPGRTSRQVLDAALEHGVSAEQIAYAMQERPEFSLDNITNYIASQGIATERDPSRYVDLQSSSLFGPGNAAISDEQIRAYINTPGITEDLVLNAALANGVSTEQIARAMQGVAGFSLENINDVVAFKQDTSSLEVLFIEQSRLIQFIADNPSYEGSKEVMDALRADLASLEQRLVDVRAKVDARIAQGQALDAVATQAENDAAAVKAKFDPLQLDSLHAQAKINEQQTTVNTAQADVDRAQAALDAANQAIAAAAGIKKKSRRHRVRGEAQAAANAASEELAAAQQRLATVQPGLAQAQADGAPAIQAALAMQPEWQAANQKAIDARAQAGVWFGASQRAVALEVAVKNMMTFDELSLIDVGQVKAGQVKELVKSGAIKGAAAAAAMRDIESDVQDVADMVKKAEAVAAADRAQESELLQRALPLQTDAYGSQLIAQSQLGDAAALVQVNADVNSAYTQAKGDLDAASARLGAAKVAFSQADFAVDWQQAKKDPKKSADGLAVMQPRFDAAKAELDAAEIAFDDAQFKFNSVKHLAVPLADAVIDAEYAAGGAMYSAVVAGQQAGAAAGWATLAQDRYQSTDALLGAMQGGLATGTRSLGQVLGAVADNTVDAEDAQVLHVQADHDLAWADTYAGWVSDTRTSAENTRSAQGDQDALVVQAGGVQILSAYLKDKVASTTQAYEKAQAELGVWQDDFQKAADQANTAAPIANDARNAMMDAETNVSAAFVQTRPSHHPPETTQSMVLPAVKELMAQKGIALPVIDPDATIDPIQLALGAGLNLNEVKARATELAQKENDRLQAEAANMTPAESVQRWIKEEMESRPTARKQLHMLDDMAQFQDADPALQAARQTALDTATTLNLASEAAIDAGETVQAGIVVAGLRGQTLLSVQTQLQQATASAAELSAKVGTNALALVGVGQAELEANQQLQRGLAQTIDSSAVDAALLTAQAGLTSDTDTAQVLRDRAQSLGNAPSMYAPQIEHAQAVVDLADQITANAQASATAWGQVAGAMKTWAAEEVTKLDQTKAVVTEEAQSLDELRTSSGATLGDMYKLDILSNAAVQEHADRVENAQELHTDRLAYDHAYKRKKTADLIKSIALGIPAAAIFILTAGETAPLIMGLFDGTALAAGTSATETWAAAVATVDGAVVPATGRIATQFVGVPMLSTGSDLLAQFGAAAEVGEAAGASTTISQPMTVLPRVLVTPGVAEVPPGSMAWLGTGIGWSGGSTAGNIVQQEFNLAVGRADKFNWQGVSDAAIIGAVTGATWGLGTQIEGRLSAGPLYQSPLYHAVPYLPKGATLVQTGRRFVGNFGSQVALKLLGVNDHISAWTALGSAASINISAQLSSVLGSKPMVSSLFGQTVIALGGFVPIILAQTVNGAPFDWQGLISRGVGRGLGLWSVTTTDSLINSLKPVK